MLHSLLVCRHPQLVASGIITPSEFWASRQHLIDAEVSKQSAQQRGTPTALITEVRPSQVRLARALEPFCFLLSSMLSVYL